MKNYKDKSLEQLYSELDLMDNMIDIAKQERKQKLELKQEQIEEQFESFPDVESTLQEKMRLIEEYKEQLNEELEINFLRDERQKIKDAIEEKEKEEDAQVGEGYR